MSRAYPTDCIPMDCQAFLRKGLALMGLDFPDAAVAALCAYHGELLKWNRKINLVAKSSEEHILENHFLDSLALLALISEGKESFVDVGTGAGFPGLVVKIVRPGLPVTLVEPRQKRVSFLRHIIRTLGLRGVDIFAGRLEDRVVMGDEKDVFSFVTSRAFTDITAFLKLAENVCAPGGRVVCMKGPGAREEISSWREQWSDGPFMLEDVFESGLPFSGAARALVVFRKRSGTHPAVSA